MEIIFAVVFVASIASIIGQDSFGNHINLDVGRCSTSCSLGYAGAYQSVLERIMEKKINRRLSFTRSQCSPLRTRVDDVLLRDGVRQIDVIESCAFRKPVKTCTRVAKFKKFFANTEFETIVDVGECRGGCRSLKHQKTCKKTDIGVISVQGPDGVLIVNTIAKCRCEQSCYRQRFNVELKELAVLPNGMKTVVDVGKCAGSCPPIKKCVMKSQDANTDSKSNCLMALETNDVKCTSVKSRVLSFTSESGHVSYVNQIRKCGCR